MSNIFLTVEEKQAEKEAARHRDELQAEVARLAGDGSVAALEAAVATLTEEANALVGSYPTLLALRDSNESLHGAAFRAARVRLNDVSFLRGDFERSLRAARERRGDELAAIFTKDRAAVSAYRASAASWSQQLEAAATLANIFDDAALAGAKASSMPPLANGLLSQVRELLNWTRSLASSGLDVRGSLTPAVRARLEAGR